MDVRVQAVIVGAIIAAITSLITTIVTNWLASKASKLKHEQDNSIWLRERAISHIEDIVEYITKMGMEDWGGDNPLNNQLRSDGIVKITMLSHMCNLYVPKLKSEEISQKLDLLVRSKIDIHDESSLSDHSSRNAAREKFADFKRELVEILSNILRDIGAFKTSNKSLKSDS